MPTFGEWERTVLDLAYDEIDMISAHAYYEEKDGDRASFLASAVDMDHFIATVAAIADEVRDAKGGTKDIAISFDEWNVWYISRPESETPKDAWPVAPRLLEDVYTATDAVVVGSLLISLLRNSDRVHAASLAQLVNVIAPIMTEPGGPAWRQATFHPFALTVAARRGRGAPRCRDVPPPRDRAIRRRGERRRGGDVGRRVARRRGLRRQSRPVGASGIRRRHRRLRVRRGSSRPSSVGGVGRRGAQHRRTAGTGRSAPVRRRGRRLDVVTLTLPPASWAMIRFGARGPGHLTSPQPPLVCGGPRLGLPHEHRERAHLRRTPRGNPGLRPHRGPGRPRARRRPAREVDGRARPPWASSSRCPAGGASSFRSPASRASRPARCSAPASSTCGASRRDPRRPSRWPTCSSAPSCSRTAARPRTSRTSPSSRRGRERGR